MDKMFMTWIATMVLFNSPTNKKTSLLTHAAFAPSSIFSSQQRTRIQPSTSSSVSSVFLVKKGFDNSFSTQPVQDKDRQKSIRSLQEWAKSVGIT
jgi:hypothetical protein